MPLCIIGSPQTPIRAHGKRGDVGIRGADLLQHPQGGVRVAIFKRQQPAVDRGEGLHLLGVCTPGAISQAYRRLNGIVL